MKYIWFEGNSNTILREITSLPQNKESMLKIIMNKYVTKPELNFCKKPFPSWSSGGLNSSIVSNKKKICYTRLLSDHQREKSQVGILDRFYPGAAIIKYIGCELNFRKKRLYISFGSSLFRRSQRNYCLVQWQIVKIWFWTLGIHLQKSCLQDRGSQQS
jgi:hypothetical protein